MDFRAALARRQRREATVETMRRAVGGVSPQTVLRGAARNVETEASRIARLERWDPSTFSVDLTDKYKTPNGTMRLRPIQSAALYWAEKTGGLVAPIGVGGGKTLLSMLLPRALRAKRAVLLLPPALRETWHREYLKFRYHFLVDKRLTLIPYSKLSHHTGADLLMQIRPDLIIADEAHNLRHVSSARTRRFLRYFEAFPETRFVPMSGTLTKRGLRDYAHLVELALRDRSPLPRDPDELMYWAACLDADGEPSHDDWKVVAPLLLADVPKWEALPVEQRQEAARGAYQRLWRTTQGVVASDERDLDVGLVFYPRKLDVSDDVRQVFAEVERTWCRPDGEELASSLDMYRVRSQLSSGFYYVWDWPDGIVDEQWMEARSEWHRQVRRVVQEDHPEFDTPFRVALGIEHGRLTRPALLAAWKAWQAVRDRPKPPVRAVWVDDFMIRDALAWARKVEKNECGGIVWYEHEAVGEALAAAGLPTYFAGEDIPHTAPAVIGASIRAHGTGTNLQYQYCKNLVLNWSPSGQIMEQLIGRTHRPGQPADEVEVHYYVHTAAAREAVERSKQDARYIESTGLGRQKLLLGTWA